MPYKLKIMLCAASLLVLTTVIQTPLFARSASIERVASDCERLLQEEPWVGEYCIAESFRGVDKNKFSNQIERAYKHLLASENGTLAAKDLYKEAQKLKGDERILRFDKMLAFQGKTFLAKKEDEVMIQAKKYDFEELRKRAESGNVEAQASLAVKYYDGQQDVVERNYPMAVQWASRAANAGNESAQWVMGEAYYFGAGVPQDRVQAAQRFLKLANGGARVAQYKYARMLLSGDGIPKDSKAGISWLTKASDAGYADAQNSLGVEYKYGLNVSKNLAAAMSLYRKAAAQGNSFAQANIGGLFENGLGVAKDHAEAARWYQLASKGGNAQAKYRLAVLHQNGWGVPLDYKIANELLNAASADGNADADFHLGYSYAKGLGVEKNGVRAVGFYSRAAEAGDQVAMFNLGALFNEGLLVTKSSKLGFYWHKMAAEKGFAPAQNSLGAMYFNGEGVEANSAWALYWYAKAAQQGAEFSADNLKRLLPQRASKLVTSNSGNLRATASADGAVLVSLARGTKVYPINNPVPGWREVYVENGHRLGFISDSVLGEPVAIQNQSPIVRATPSSLWPAKPAARAGVTTCNTKCVNGDCHRVYSNGKKIRFQAKQKWNPFTSQFEWDSGGC